MENKTDKKFCTIFAWRYKSEGFEPNQKQWHIDTSFISFHELEKLWQTIHRQPLEIRKNSVFLNAQMSNPTSMRNWPYRKEEFIEINRDASIICRSPFLDRALNIK